VFAPFPTVDNSSVFILYGSQTGNGESLATDLSERLTEAGVPNESMTLNAAKKMDLKGTASLLVIICSTTGNGDAPENADGWWRTIKLRSAVRYYTHVSPRMFCLCITVRIIRRNLQAKDMFEGVPYTVLGLGDTNYDKFCHMGKSIDKRLEELGGRRVLPPYFADEGTGVMEETVEAWKVAVFEVAKTLGSKESST
jgi:methionine synthase reductase